ncbi:hypothetical protein WJX82_001682 [Trebouxia sp. C0006]
MALLAPQTEGEIQTPRQYQTELFFEARKRNVIAYLDTGSGKTLVSVLLIKDKAGSLNENGHKRVTIFLAPKVLLVQQQADVLRKHTSLRVSHFCGDMNVDYWDRRRWGKELQEQDIWVMTPQILLNVLRHGFLKITDLNLLVCDECHRAIKKDPYNCIMQEFYHDRSTEGVRPHIFGMTASPVNTRAKQTQMKVAEAVWQLERNMDAQVITVIDRDPVTAAAPLPELKLLYYVRQHTSDSLKEVEAGLAAAIWTLHRGETVMAQLEAARAQQAAEAACIGLTLDEEKITSLSASTRRHLQGLAIVVQELGPWCAAAVLLELLRSKQVNNLMDPVGDIAADNRYTEEGPDSAAIRKTPEVQALNVALREVAKMLTQALPLSKRRRLASAHALSQIDPAAHNFKVLLRHVVSRVMDAIPSKLLDQELGIKSAPDQNEEVGPEPQSAEAVQEEEQGRVRLPLFTNKVMTLVQDLLQYKDDVTASKLAAYSTMEEAAKRHWSAILFVTRKMTALGLDALFKSAPCLKAWRAATLVGYGGSLASSCLTSKAQHGVLQQMKGGELDIVISTAVAEEGLDVKQCQLVIRFDLPSTLLAFVQSRGRARAHGSHYVLMLERGNRDHELLLSQVVGYEANMRFHAKRRPGLGEEEVKEEERDVTLTEMDINHIPLEMREYRVASTEARVTLASAKPLLYMFCAKLPADRYTVLRPRFSTQVLGEDARLMGYQSSAILPNNSPVRIAQGQIQRTRALAQASASLEACKQLHQSGALDENLLPDVPTFELDPDDDSDEEILFAKAMPVTARKRRNAAAVAAAMIDMNGFQTVMSPAEAKAVQKQITIKPKIPEILKQPAEPDDKGVTTWLLYKFTITAKMGFMYHIPGPDEDPDDPKTNTCPLDPVLENKLNMLAALPKQIFGMLVPKELPDVRALMPYSLRLPHARDALDCKFDLVGPVRFSQDQMDEIKSFHAAMMEGPQKKKNPKKVAEELKKLTEAARKALVLEADQAIPDSGTVAYRIISSDASDPSKSTAAFTISDDSQAVISKGTAAFSLLAGDHSIPNGTGTASLEVHSVPSEISTESASAVGDGAVPGPGSSCLDAGDASLSAGLTSIPSTNGTVPSSNGIVPNSSMTGFKLGQLDPQRLKNSVVVTTYNSTPYFYEGTDPQLTPESKFPDDKLKLQLVVEEEEEDDFMKPPPSKETDAPTDKPAYQAEQSADKGGESTSVTAATAAAAATGAAAGSEEGGKEADDLAVRLIASKKASTFTEYFKTRWNQEGLDPGQPLLRVGLANRRRDTPYEGGVFLVPQLCIAHPLTRQCFIMSKLVHQVLHYVNNCLLTSELQPKLVKAPHRMPNIVYVLEALTPKACQEDYSYERFELLGDAFLKYAVSLFLFLKFPEAHEGQLAGRKGAVVANTNLVKIAIHNGLKYYMLAPLPRGKGARKRAELGLSTTQQLKSKAWADVVESLIGCIYLEAGYMIQSGYGANSDAEDSDLAESRSANPEEIEIAEEEVEGDILLPPSPSQAAHPMELDPAPIGMLASSVPAGDGTIPEQARLGSNLSSRDDDDQVKMDAQAFLAMEEDSGDEHQARPSRGKVWRPPQELIDSYSSGIEAVLGYKFQKRALLQEALTHTSWPDATQQGYQRLEFLGDAVLDLLMTRYYFTTYRDSSPGTLSDLRSASVNNTRLASVAVLHKIHTFIRHCSSPLFHDIGLFVEQLQQAVADQEKKIIEQQQVLRQQQRLEAARAGGIMDLEDGVQHPLGGPKPDKPKSKRKRHIYNKEAVRGKPRELQADDDAKAAALMWASEAAFGNTEVAAPKILGDIVESLVGAVYIDSHCNFDRTWQIFQPLMSPLLSPSTVPKHPIRHLHERAQQDGKLLKFVCSVSNPRSEGVSPMEEAEQKRKNGQIPAGITPEQAAEDARQVVERQKQWQQRWRERHERESALYDAVAVVEDVIIGRCIGATNKALAKRRAAEDALRIIAQKEAAVAAAAVAQQAAELQAALAVPGMESTAPVSPSASPPTEDAAAAAPAADVT